MSTHNLELSGFSPLGCVVIRPDYGERIMLQNIADLDSGNGKTYREINNETNHRFEIGQLVELDSGVRLFVAKQSRDCDGTPMYVLTSEMKGEHPLNQTKFIYGYAEENLKDV